MNLTYKIRLLILLSLGVLIMSCNSPSSTDIIKSFEDTTEAIYGPYRLYKLPIDKGVAVINPVQVSLGPGGRIFGANQSGEIYTLHDSNGDGIEDEAKLYADINEFGLHSPVGFAHKGDTVFIGTRTEVRAYLDLDQDAQADTSWTFFSGYPVSEHPYEWTSALNFGPDGWLYLVLTTDSFNSGASPDPKRLRGSMLRVSPFQKPSQIAWEYQRQAALRSCSSPLFSSFSPYSHFPDSIFPRDHSMPQTILRQFLQTNHIPD